MTRDETMALATEIAAQIDARDVADHGTAPIVAAILHAIDRVRAPTRIQAAERDVVEFALAVPYPENYATPNLAWAVDRLRVLREQHQAEECPGAQIRNDRLDVGVGIARLRVQDQNMGRSPEEFVVRCHLPRGHGGPHEGEIGRWRWEP